MPDSYSWAETRNEILFVDDPDDLGRRLSYHRYAPGGRSYQSSQLGRYRTDDFAQEWGMEHAILTGHVRMEVIA